MASVEVDAALLEEAVRLGNHRTKREAATAALREYVKLKLRLGLLELVGKIDFDPTHDYKTDRRRSGKRIPRP
jgi:Arc/MetJ family transcription regulator